ncbi:hypothetical protein HPB48_016211 [Haemaphysalis longicornis]|uniref:Major facilitator superfamily (MFS) profile domain-containing protein n=1 Tax=Haemaphysalis longicornis TaxID=44386 RepID=A0A9J6FW46_HAELO|nr:hypothetical protein HPB48_016211 [Haemaphysalis longicornis]
MQHIIPANLEPIDLEASEGFDCGEAFGHGNFQRGFFFFAVLSMWVQHCNTLAFPLISGDVDHWCRQPGHLNITADQWKELAIPVHGDGQRSRCNAYAQPSDPNDTTVVPCDEWDYDAELAPTSIVSYWDIVCGRAWRITFVNGLSMIGSLVFLSVSGFLADRVGRRLVAFGAASLLMVTSFGHGFASTYLVYVATKFFVSGCCSVLFVASSVLLMEVSAHKYRVVHCGLAFAIGLTLGDLCFAIIKQFRHLGWIARQLLIMAPTALIPVGFCLLTESPRFLIAKRQLKNAEALMKAAAQTNGFPLHGPMTVMDRTEEKLRHMSLSPRQWKALRDVSSAEVLRRRALIVFGSGFSILLAHYALLLAWSARKTALMQGVSVTTNVICCATLLPFFNRSSRNKVLIAGIVVTGTLCSLFGIASTGGGTNLMVVRSVVLVVAEAACFIVLVFNMTYTLEIFPTPVRGVVTCLSFAFGRLGGVLAAPISAVRGAGREDLLFALIAVVLCGAAWLLRSMPGHTEIASNPEIKNNGGGGHRGTGASSASRQDRLEEMKKTLEIPKRWRKEHRRKSSTYHSLSAVETSPHGTEPARSRKGSEI